MQGKCYLAYMPLFFNIFCTSCRECFWYRYKFLIVSSYASNPCIETAWGSRDSRSSPLTWCSGLSGGLSLFIFCIIDRFWSERMLSDGLYWTRLSWASIAGEVASYTISLVHNQAALVSRNEYSIPYFSRLAFQTCMSVKMAHQYDPAKGLLNPPRLPPNHATDYTPVS